MNNRAIIAMSGGVDSSVAAHLAASHGYDILGVTLRLYDGETDAAEKTCCSLSDVEDAAQAARRLGIPHYVFNMKDEFETEVISRFIDAYEHGRTPNPCIDCNRYIKFDALMRRADALDCGHIVTGHYARICCEGGRYLLKKGIDPTKDQSYVLYSLTQEQLARTILPLGGMRKSDVRELAESLGFVNARKRDSQDICFVPDGDYAGFIRRATGKDYPAGNFVDTDGNVLGTHKGIIGYTVGQRKGLGLSLPAPLYVQRIDTDNNRVVLAPNDALFTSSLDAGNINLIACDTLDAPIRASVKIRYSQTEQPATVTQTDADTLHIEFDAPQRAVTKGQAAVIYDGDTVIGGGVIK